MKICLESRTAAAVNSMSFARLLVGLVAMSLGFSSLLMIPAATALPAADAGDPVAVRIDKYEVRQSEFEQGFSKFERDTTLSEAENRKLYRGSVVDRYLLLLDAEEKGFFDENAVLEQMLVDFTNYLLVDRIRDTDIRSKVEIDDEMVREFYDRHAVLYDVSQIILPTEERAQEVIARLRQGEEFVDLARQYSVDAKSRRDGGQLKPFVWSATSIRFMNELSVLEPGTISEPVRSDYGYHVLRLNALLPREQEPFEERRAFIQRQLDLRLQGELQTDFYHSLRDRYDCRADLDTAMELAAIYARELDRAEAAEPMAEAEHQAAVAKSKIVIPSEMLARPVLTWRLGETAGQYTVANSWRYMQELPAGVLLDRRNPHQIISDGYSEFHRNAMSHLARERNMHLDPTVVESVESKREELILTMFYQQEIIDKSSFTEQDERDYYQENLAKRFSHPKVIRMARVRYQQREPAEETERVMAIGGDELAALIQQHDDQGLLITQEPDTGWITESADPLLFERAVEMRTGDIGRYIDPDGYWTVFLIREMNESRTESFDEARQLIQRDLQVYRSEEVLNEFLAVLRERYEIWVDDTED